MAMRLYIEREGRVQKAAVGHRSALPYCELNVAQNQPIYYLATLLSFLIVALPPAAAPLYY